MFIGTSSQHEDDDASGYLRDWILKYCKDNNITTANDVWKNDVAAKEFMIHVLKLSGAIQDE